MFLCHGVIWSPLTSSCCFQECSLCCCTPLTLCESQRHYIDSLAVLDTSPSDITGDDLAGFITCTIALHQICEFSLVNLTNLIDVSLLRGLPDSMAFEGNLVHSFLSAPLGTLLPKQFVMSTLTDQTNSQHGASFDRCIPVVLLCPCILFLGET